MSGRIYEDFGVFLSSFVRDLNDKSEEGWSLLVEGPRDYVALKELGYRGQVFTISVLGRGGYAALRGVTKVVILTDLDREGTLLASKYLRLLAHEGIKASLSERRRLRSASRGVFLHIENLSRFSESSTARVEPDGPPREIENLRKAGPQEYRRRRTPGGTLQP
ncbi:MAG: toprim domain-containing protein [Nitrososphaerota archaeon]|nr:toprim domain-containing protein [Nitrososphaerota archaeon]MDG6942850.1 toprim domain-containing protein [Nitrososphaerota archaeon]MDG6950830.1 toprim domain-containing protein [Nitrososphaerota archaeon]